MTDLQQVESRMIRAVGYDPETKELEVLFNTGKLYIYEGVEPDVRKGLMEAESKGQYMLANVIDVYPYHLPSRRRR